MNIFVYGTLRRGGGLNYRIQNLREPIGKFSTVPKYTLWDMGCPCLDHGGDTSVVGEVYKFDELSEIANIHAMELAVGYTFERVELTGFPDEAFAYFLKPDPGWWINKIESGDWIEHKRSMYGEDQIRT